MATHRKYPLDLHKSKIVVAVAQITGPLPSGKHKTVINDRETLGWKSLNDIKSRIDKAVGILDELNKSVLKPDFVLFPEYSIPVQKALPQLQDRANEYGF